MSVPVIKLSGSAFERGLTYGRQTKDKIAAVFNLYQEKFFQKTDAALEPAGMDYYTQIEAHLPDLAQEISGVAEGSGIPVWKITCLNARTEIYMLTANEPVAECTSIFLEESRLFGQNWDWASDLESLMVLLDVSLENGRRYMTLTEPGILAKIGINSDGLGVGLNILYGKISGVGLPTHILLRHFLEQESFDACLSELERLKGTTCSCSNVFLTHADGRQAQVELWDRRVFVGKAPFHTNHYQFTNEQVVKDSETKAHVFLGNSQERFDRVTELMQAQDNAFDHLAAMLHDRQGQNPIHGPYINVGPFDIGTVCTIILDLPQRQFYISNHGQDGFTCHPVTSG